MRVGVGTIGVVALGVVAAIFFGRGGGSGSGGTGTGSGTSSSLPNQAMQPTPPQRPLRVTIRENGYVVNGQTVDLVSLTDMAGKVPPGSGAAVMVERSPSSRAKAEQDLKDALTKKGVSYTSD
jgi:hypothetical protein